ncbi:homocitrate synthase [Pseudomaricurvus alkylphenolicus]|uniref:LeuA family protein n=1 Tax=Pseudomaricurvus alkylphenolicus TaxID=1306991 RepID=UPI0014203188|nr:homocitrate synthase [Pseudomaricurvus alkylphenolicus]NIB44452.1 homocitrate synthase [Pseudomaricurvus alkylphenolicus]
MYDIDRLNDQKGYLENKFWVSPYNYDRNINAAPTSKRIALHDVTLRDGEQTFGVAYSIADRVRIAEALSELGVARIEAGMPIVSKENREGIKQVVDLDLDCEVTVLVRANPLDIDLAVDCGIKTVVLEHCMNPYLNETGYHLEKSHVIERCVDSVSYAKEKGLNVVFMGWDTTRCDDLDYLKDTYVTLSQECKPDSIVLVDTFGVASPRTAGYLVKTVKQWIPEIAVEYHNHNEFGLANAGVLEAISAGADVVHTAINGLGERTGNAATEEVAAMLEILLGVETGIDLERLMDTSVLVENITNRSVPMNKPIVGRGLFDMETGIGIDLIRKMGGKGFDMATSSMLPSVVGQPPGRVVLGKNSGRASVEYFLDKHELAATPDQLDAIVEQVKFEGRLQRALLSDVQFLSICEKVL